MAFDGDETWTDDQGDSVTLAVNDNHDGEHVVLWMEDVIDGTGIALNAESLDALIEHLQTLRAGL